MNAIKTGIIRLGVRAGTAMLAAALALVTLAALPAPALASTAITGVTARGAAAPGHPAASAVDGKTDTWWESPAANSMQDYRRFIELDLHGLYALDSVAITNRPGSSYRYEIYASENGDTYQKVAYQAQAKPADGVTPTVYQLPKVRARFLRVQVSYNSASQAVNLVEVGLSGEKISSEPAPAATIAVADFADTHWGAEWERVENDPEYAAQKTIKELGALVERVLGADYRNAFSFELRDKVDGKDVFEISDRAGGGVLIRGNDGVSLASGLNYYLRHWCKVDYNPLFGSNLQMPAKLPPVGKKVLKFTNYEYRYALNFCTYSYTMAFWNWSDYEPFLDWAAMNGINLMLDIVGQEEVLRQTLKQYGYTDEEVKDYLVGPGYQAWFYMQNIYGVAGPLPNAWFEQRTELARRIHDRMQAYGIDPVIQGFGGQVPVDFEKKNPKAIAASSGSWSDFARPFMIKTYLTDQDKEAGKQDYFQKVGTTFYEVQDRLFGKVSHYYAVDPFHEGGKVPAGFDIVDIYRTVQQKMLDHDSAAIWVMQQWQWGINEQKLSGLANKAQALVLDMQSDLRSQAEPMENQGVPWVWNMLHNFGGRMGMDGVPEVLATKVTQAYNSAKYMKGIGITPEALDNSPIVYELLLDMTWEQDPLNYRTWTDEYLERRYGGTDEKIRAAWDILLDTAYHHRPGEYYQGASESIMNARPADNPIQAASTWGHSDIDYDKHAFEQAAQLFIDSYDRYRASAAFRYDFVDVMRQVLANAFQELQPQAGEAYKAGNLDKFRALSGQMLAVIKAQDTMLATADEFLLGNWINDARTMLTNADDWTKDLFEFNARALVTTWGMQKNSSLVDYSNRQWAGLTGEYYLGRWQAYADKRIAKLAQGTAFSDPDWFSYGWEWANRKSDEGYGFATKAANADQRQLAQTIMDRYSLAALEKHGNGAATERVNLAAGKDVIDTATQAKIPYLTDGATDTGWVQPGKANATLEIALGGSFSITGASITLQQIAADFPLRYEIEVFDGEKWVEIGRSAAATVSSKNEVAASVTGSKVRFHLHATDGQNLTGIYELAVWGSGVPAAEYKNLSLGATATAYSAQDGRGPELGIDGKGDTLWVNNGAGQSWYQVTLAKPARVDRVRLVFEQAGREFQFKMTAKRADGSERVLVDQSANQGALNKIYDVPLGEEVSYVRVDFTGAVPGSTPWPAIAELELLQLVGDEVPLTNIAPLATITSSPTKDAPEDKGALVDGKSTAWVSRDGAVPAWFQLDWAKAASVDNIRLDFEPGVPDRSMQFTLKVLDAQGKEHIVYERTEADLAQPQGLTIDVPVKREIKQVRMDITAARVPSYGGPAWPLVAEIGVFATPNNIAPAANLQAGAGATLPANAHAVLTDGVLDKGVTLTKQNEKQLVFEFAKPADIDAVLLAFADMKVAPRFTVEYRASAANADAPEQEPPAAGKWQSLFDYTANGHARSSMLLRAKKAVYADALRLNFTNEGEVPLAEVAIYAADATGPLAAYLDSVRAELAGLQIGNYAGNYRADARAALDKVLAGADAVVAAGADSRTVAAWQTKVTAAVREFYRDGFVSLERGELYVAIDDASAVQAALDKLGNEAAARQLAAALKAAQQVATGHGQVTQQDIDTAVQQLNDAAQKVLDILAASDRYQVALTAAQSTLASAVVGDFEGQYPAAMHDTFAQAIAAAQAAYQQVGDDPAAIDTVTAALRDATTAFIATKIHLDTAALAAAIAQAQTFAEADYDSAAWQTMQRALANAKSVDPQAISQPDLDKVTAALTAALDKLALAKLDRGALAEEIADALNAREGDYTPESWEKFAHALADALTARDAVSTTQQEIDKAATALAAAAEGLELRSHGTGGDEGGTGTDEGGAQAGGTGDNPGGAGSNSGNGGGNTVGAGGAGTLGAQTGGTSNLQLSHTGSDLLAVLLTAAFAVAAGTFMLRRPYRVSR